MSTTIRTNKGTFTGKSASDHHSPGLRPQCRIQVLLRHELHRVEHR